MDTLIQELEQSAKADRATPKKSNKARFMLAGGLAVAVAAGTLAYLHFRDRVSTDDAQVDAHVAPIAAKVGGNISSILVDDNETVKEGQILLRIDPRDLQAK